MPNVQVSKGRVQAVFGFGDRCSGFEAVECTDFKIMKADTFVLCSNLHFAKQLIDSKVYAPLLRIPTDLIARYSKKAKLEDIPLKERIALLNQLNGPCSVLTLDSMPLLGRSSRYVNLFYFVGITSANIELRKKAAQMLAN